MVAAPRPSWGATLAEGIGLAEDLKAAARAVLAGLKPSAGGDAYYYEGSVASVEWLISAAGAFEEWQIMSVPINDDDTDDC